MKIAIKIFKGVIPTFVLMGLSMILLPYINFESEVLNSLVPMIIGVTSVLGGLKLGFWWADADNKRGTWGEIKK